MVSECVCNGKVSAPILDIFELESQNNFIQLFGESYKISW